MFFANQFLFIDINNRKLIIALTDGEDNSSKNTYNEISSALR